MKPYIVIFKDNCPSSKIDEHISDVEAKGGKVKQRFDSEIMKGFAATMPEEHASILEERGKGGKDEHIDCE